MNIRYRVTLTEGERASLETLVRDVRALTETAQP